jgi:predicted RNA polymerase sigma factor
VAVEATDTHRAIDAVWGIEAPRLIAGLARIVRDVGLAEDLAQDALVAALQQWPDQGIPNNPGAWLMAAAKHRAIDQIRRRTLLERKHEQLGYELDSAQAAPDLDTMLDDDVGDDLLRLIFTACHPVLSTDARVALTLRLLGGSRVRFSSASPRSRSASSGRRRPSRTSTFRSRCHADRSWPRGCRRSWM